MKLLLDQNISYRIVKKITHHFPNCVHVSNHNLDDTEDPDIWEFAKKNDFAIVTFDSDFYDISIISGIPPKIIWLRTGNLTTNELAEVLIKNRKRIESFLKNEETKIRTCLEII